jgi:hypothetical protein
MMKKAWIVMALALLTVQACADDESVVDKAGNGIKKGAEATGTAIGKGVDATGNAIKNGADATGRGLQKGLNATGNGLKSAGDWINRKLRRSDSTNSDSNSDNK